jgi:dTDP-4-dehydrorhamnose reductase
MRVVIIGGSGQLGSDLYYRFKEQGHEVFSLSHGISGIEILDKFNVESRLLSYAPEAVVNCAALHTAPCEKDPEKAYLVNAIGARNLAQYCKEMNALMVQISTDQVFDGVQTSAYTEYSVPNPRTVYGSTKLAGEYFVKNSGARYQIVRTTCLFGVNPTRGKVGGLNFVDMMLEKAKTGEVSVVDDEYTTPTSTETLAQQIVVLAVNGVQGTFHAVGEGYCSWNQFAREIFYQARVECKVSVPKSNPSDLVRSKHLVLANNRLHRLNLSLMQPWQSELRQYLVRKGECRSQ